MYPVWAGQSIAPFHCKLLPCMVRRTCVTRSGGLTGTARSRHTFSFVRHLSGRSFVGTIGERRRNCLSSRRGTFLLLRCLSYVACIPPGKIEQTHSACLLLLIYYPYLDLAKAMVTRLPLFDLARNGQPRMVLATALR
jgi:hypothetical protein